MGRLRWWGSRKRRLSLLCGVGRWIARWWITTKRRRFSGPVYGSSDDVLVCSSSPPVLCCLPSVNLIGFKPPAVRRRRRGIVRSALPRASPSPLRESGPMAAVGDHRQGASPPAGP
ncbi:hypothetical protein ISCGN_031964 [Ixodes scapularis]